MHDPVLKQYELYEIDSAEAVQGSQDMFVTKSFFWEISNIVVKCRFAVPVLYTIG